MLEGTVEGTVEWAVEGPWEEYGTYRHGRECLTLERKRNAVNNVPGSNDVIIDHTSAQPLQTGYTLT